MRYSLNKLKINIILSLICHYRTKSKSLYFKTTQRILSTDDKPAPGLELDFIIISSCLLTFIILLIIIIIVIYRRKKLFSINLLDKKAIPLQEDMEMTRSVRVEKTNEKVDEHELVIKDEESKKNLSQLSKKGEIVFDNVKRVLKPKKNRNKENFIDEDQIRGYYLDTFNEEKRNHIIEKEKQNEKKLEKKMVVISAATNRPLRSKQFGRENLASEGSDISMKKLAQKVVHKDLVQFTNSNRSSPESSFDEEDFQEEEQPVENIKAPMTMKQMLNKVNKVLDEEDKKIDNEEQSAKSKEDSHSSDSSDSASQSSESGAKKKKSERLQSMVVDKIMKSKKRKGIVEQTIL